MWRRCKTPLGATFSEAQKPRPLQGRGSSQQELQSNQDEVSASSLMERGGGALLEQNEYQDVEDLFDRDWIIEFRRSMPPMIGLIWGGSIKNMRREAG